MFVFSFLDFADRVYWKGFPCNWSYLGRVDVDDIPWIQFLVMGPASPYRP